MVDGLAMTPRRWQRRRHVFNYWHNGHLKKNNKSCHNTAAGTFFIMPVHIKNCAPVPKKKKISCGVELRPKSENMSRTCDTVKWQAFRRAWKLVRFQFQKYFLQNVHKQREKRTKNRCYLMPSVRCLSSAIVEFNWWWGNLPRHHLKFHWTEITHK